MTLDWQNVLVVIAVGGAVGYLAYSLWPRSADQPSSGCGSCGSGCNADSLNDAAQPVAKPIVRVEDLLKKRVG